MNKETFFEQIEACYAQQESMEFLPITIREQDGSFNEYSYSITRFVRPITSATIEREQDARRVQGYEVEAEMLNNIKAQETQRLAEEEATRLAKIEADRLRDEETAILIESSI